jgi:hypothetical protein
MRERQHTEALSIPCDGGVVLGTMSEFCFPRSAVKSRVYVCQDAMVRKELTRSGINGAAHQCVRRGGLRIVPIFWDIPKAYGKEDTFVARWLQPRRLRPLRRPRIQCQLLLPRHRAPWAGPFHINRLPPKLLHLFMAIPTT